MLNRVSLGQDHQDIASRYPWFSALIRHMLTDAEGTALTATTTGSPEMKTVPSETFPAPSNTRLSSQLGDPNSGLRSITEFSGAAVVIHVGGDIDASNE